MRNLAIVAALCTAWLCANGARAQEALDDEQRTRVHVGFLAAAAAVVPLSGYADREGGGGFDMGLYLSIDEALLIGTLGVAQSFSDQSDNRWLHVPADVMLGYFFDRWEIAPYIGLGVGIHYLDETVFVERTVGTVLRSSSHDVIEDSAMGLNLRLRLGIVLWRTRVLNMMGALDYDATFADFQQRSGAQAFRVSIALIVGGGNE